MSEARFGKISAGIKNPESRKSSSVVTLIQPFTAVYICVTRRLEKTEALFAFEKQINGIINMFACYPGSVWALSASFV